MVSITGKWLEALTLEKLPKPIHRYDAHLNSPLSSVLSMANLSSRNTVGPISGPPIPISSLDGGGIGGLSSALIVLRDLMERVAAQKGLSQQSIRPSEYFNLIVGTGTGGISSVSSSR